MRRPIWITSEELYRYPEHSLVILNGRISKTGDLVMFRGERHLLFSLTDDLGSTTVLADKRFEYVLIDKELPVLVVGKKARMDGKTVVVADSLNFPIQPTTKFRHVLASIENR